MKLISYELNEVPWQVIDLYVKQKPHSALAKLLKTAHQLTTMTHDSYEYNEIHPWSTWPTLHRGVYNDQHQIRFINQDITTPYPPVWELLAAQGYRVGVFGSLQSWPIPTKLPFCFYIPDTFAKDPQTYPKKFEVFQAFNLEQTERDSAVAGPIKIQKYVGTLLKLLMQGLRFRTLLRLGRHLLNEKRNPDYKSRRSTLQAPLAFDFYWQLLKQTQPDFSTFFTNHVAGMMHRYWKYLFPAEFNYTLQTERDFFLAQNIIAAMDIADEQLGQLKQFCDQHHYVLSVASSMGQHAVAEGYCGELRLHDSKKFIEKLGFSGRVEAFIAMQPDTAFKCDSVETLKQFKAAAEKLQNESGHPFFRSKTIGLSLNLYLGGFSSHVLETKQVYIDQQAESLEDYGIDVIYRDPGTGHHTPEGMAFFYGKGVTPSTARSKVESTQILPTLLQAYQVPLADYMAKPIPGVFVS